MRGSAAYSIYRSLSDYIKVKSAAHDISIRRPLRSHSQNQPDPEILEKGTGVNPNAVTYDFLRLVTMTTAAPPSAASAISP